MTGGTDTCINHYRHRGLVDDNLQKILHSQTLVGTDGGSQWHHGSCTSLFQMFAQRRVGLAVWQHHKAQFYQLLGGLQGLNRVGQQVAWVGVYLQLQPVGAKGLAGHLGSKHRLFSITHTRGIG